MILKTDVIAECLEKADKPETEDPLVISPQPDLKKLTESGSASVDLRLGTWFVTLRPTRKSHIEIEEKDGDVGKIVTFVLKEKPLIRSLEYSGNKSLLYSSIRILREYNFKPSSLRNAIMPRSALAGMNSSAYNCTGASVIMCVCCSGSSNSNVVWR